MNLVTTKPSFFNKLFRTKKYKSYLEQKTLSENTLSTLNERNKTIEEELDKLNEEYYENLGRKQECEQRIERVNSAKTLEDLGYNIMEAIKLLQENNLPIIIEESEKGIYNIGKIEEEKDMVLIHKTDYMPKNGRIETTNSAGKSYSEKIKFADEEFEITYNEGRNTVHFSANHEVIEHGGESWEKRRYAVIIPFEDIEQERIGSACPVDTFVLGEVKLTPNSYILCPKGEGELLRRDNPNINILVYRCL